MTIISFQEINNIILNSNKVKSNEDVNRIIYNFYSMPSPKFKKGETCIRNYGGGKKQVVSIDNFYYEKKYNTYYYEYSYFPSSDGYCYESSLRKLTKSEENKSKTSLFSLPMDMCSWN